MLKLKVFVLKTKKELLEAGTKYAPYSALCYVPWMNRTMNATGLTAESAKAALRTRIVKTMENVEEVVEEEMPIASYPEGGELGTLMEAARGRAQSIADSNKQPPMDYMQLGGTKPWSESASEAYQVSERLIGTLLALEPLAAIADAYDANGLDETRPDWVAAGNETYDPQKELYCGRGGKTLLTLQHALTAREVLKGTLHSRLLTSTFRNQKHALKEIRTWANSGESAATIVDHIRKALKDLDP